MSWQPVYWVGFRYLKSRHACSWNKRRLFSYLTAALFNSVPMSAHPRRACRPSRGENPAPSQKSALWILLLKGRSCPTSRSASTCDFKTKVTALNTAESAWLFLNPESGRASCARNGGCSFTLEAGVWLDGRRGQQTSQALSKYKLYPCRGPYPGPKLGTQ